MMTIKLRSAVNAHAQMIQNNAGKPFFTCKHSRKTGKVISIFQSTFFSKSSIDTVRKSDLIGKIMLCGISQG